MADDDGASTGLAFFDVFVDSGHTEIGCIEMDGWVGSVDKGGRDGPTVEPVTGGF